MKTPLVDDAVDVFSRMTGCTADDGDERSLLYATYAELSVTVFYFVTAYATVLLRRDDVSVQLFAFLCVLIESFILLCIAFRLYHRRHFRNMNRYAATVAPVPPGYRSKIRALTAYHAIASNVFVAVPAAYAAAYDSVRAGDQFTYPYLDVLPGGGGGRRAAVYALKYAAYAVPVYIAHVELCFINITFLHYSGVTKRGLSLIAATVRRAVADGDERALKHAVRRHQEFLGYFATMKKVFAKPILLTISFNAIYFGLTTSLVIQSIQGYLNQVILSICVASSAAAAINMTIYAVYGSIMSDLHVDLLRGLFDYSLFITSKSFKSTSLIMMARATIPLNFKIGYIFTVDLNLLVKIVKMSYTVLNVLLSSASMNKSHKL